MQKRKEAGGPIDISTGPIGVSTEPIGAIRAHNNGLDLTRPTDRRDRINTRSTEDSVTEIFGQDLTYRLTPYAYRSSPTPSGSALRAKLQDGVSLASLLAPFRQSPRCFCGAFLGVKAAAGIDSHVKQFRVCRRCGREYLQAQV